MSVDMDLVTTDLVKAEAVGAGTAVQAGRGPGASLVADPFVWAVADGLYKEKPSPVSYSILRYLCHRDSIIASIVLTRLRQVKTFSRLRTHDEAERTTTTGWRVRLRQDSGKRTVKAEGREDELNRFIARCGREDIRPFERSFGSFLWKFTKDRLEFDQASAEIRRDKKGEIIEFFAVDGATTRIVNPTGRAQETGTQWMMAPLHTWERGKRTGDKTWEDEQIAYVQVHQGRIVAKYSDADLIFAPENISTAIELNGYSTSETEIALKNVMAHLGIDETNQRQFHPGSMPKGVMTLEGAEMSEEQIQVLEARWRTQVANYRGKHRVPFVPLPRGAKLSFLSLPQATDIEFGTFLDYLVNMLTALWGMDPAEINFPNRSGSIGGASPTMIQSSPEATRLTASRDKGLRSLLSFLEDTINTELLPYIDDSDDFEFGFVGFDRQSDQDRLSQDDTKCRTYMTINEVREAHGLKARKDCEIIRDATWWQAKQAELAQQQQLQVTSGEGGEEAPDFSAFFPGNQEENTLESEGEGKPQGTEEGTAGEWAPSTNAAVGAPQPAPAGQWRGRTW